MSGKLSEAQRQLQRSQPQEYSQARHRVGAVCGWPAAEELKVVARLLQN